jgi:hypothetical protein
MQLSISSPILHVMTLIYSEAIHRVPLRPFTQSSNTFLRPKSPSVPTNASSLPITSTTAAIAGDPRREAATIKTDRGRCRKKDSAWNRASSCSKGCHRPYSTTSSRRHLLGTLAGERLTCTAHTPSRNRAARSSPPNRRSSTDKLSQRNGTSAAGNDSRQGTRQTEARFSSA